MSFANVDKIYPLLTKIVESQKNKSETLEVQICLKGYDYKKDPRFDANILLPYKKRKNERILIIADKILEEHAKSAGLPYVTYEQVQGTTKEKKVMKNKLALKHHAFISEATFNKAFEMRVLNRKSKPVFVTKNVADIRNFYEEVCRTTKFKLKKSNTLSFAAGYLEMPAEEMAQNVVAGLGFLVTLLKKGVQNIDSVYLKSTQSEAIRLF